MNRTRFAWTLALLLLLTSEEALEAKEIKVGVTEYQNVELTYDKYQKFFRSLEREGLNGESVTFRFAIGTYAEVADWYNKQLIDVAVLSAMPMSDLLSNATADDLKLIRGAYLGHLSPVGARAAPCRQDECPRALDESEPRCFTASDPREPGKSHYSVSVVVPASYGWTTFEDVKRQAGKGTLKFLFVRPVSISGYMVPSFFLNEQSKQLGLDLSKEESEFTFQHRNSLQRMLENPPRESDRGKYLVAFVIDNTSYCVRQEDSQKKLFSVLETPHVEGLEGRPSFSELKIPHEAVLLNYYLDERLQLDYKKTLTELFRRKPQNASFNITLPGEAGDWVKEYDTSSRIYATSKVPRTLLNSSTFEDFIRSLEIYEKSAQRPPRLALVLSGGGAKCAYQAGAVAAIEDKLRELGAGQPLEKRKDFNLIVGTSGGAINALLVSLGGTSNSATQEQISNMWKSFKQKDFFKPSPLFNLLFGLLFGLLQALAICGAVLLFGRGRVRWNRVGKVLICVQLIEVVLAIYLDALSARFALFVFLQPVVVIVTASVVRAARAVVIDVFKTDKANWWRIAGWLMLLLSVLEVVISFLQLPGAWPVVLDEEHLLHHLWLILTLIFSNSFPWPLLLGAGMTLSGIWKFRPINWTSYYPLFLRSMAAGLLVVGGFLILHALMKEPSASNSSEIEKAFINNVPRLIASLSGNFPDASGGGREEKLRDISRRIIGSPELIKRDLVITVSRLPLKEEPLPDNERGNRVPANQLPEDLYFYYKSPLQNSHPPTKDKRFVPFKDNPDKLLDVVIGSGTIYPLFPYRELESIRVENKEFGKMKIIDGGFIHNSPVEAAIKWGATHIILIEASPMPKPYDPSSFLDNAFVALKYIMAQTQRIDLQARGSVEIFELRPTSECDKQSLTGDCEEQPEPNMDTFDFSESILKRAFAQGMKDAGSKDPLFKRVPGPPLFRLTRRQTEQPAQ